MPAFLHWIEGFEWVLLTALAAVAAVIVWWVYSRTYKFMLPRFEKRNKKWQYCLLKSTHKPLGYVLWILVVSWTWQQFVSHIHGKLLIPYWPLIYQIVAVAALFVVGMGYIACMQKSKIMQIDREGGQKASKTTVVALSQLLRSVLIVIALITILQIAGYLFRL